MCVSFYIFTVISASTFLYYGNNCLCVCSLTPANAVPAVENVLIRHFSYSASSSRFVLLFISTICVRAEYT